MSERILVTPAVKVCIYAGCFLFFAVVSWCVFFLSLSLFYGGGGRGERENRRFHPFVIKSF